MEHNRITGVFGHMDRNDIQKKEGNSINCTYLFAGGMVCRSIYTTCIAGHGAEMNM